MKALVKTSATFELWWIRVRGQFMFGLRPVGQEHFECIDSDLDYMMDLFHQVSEETL